MAIRISETEYINTCADCFYPVKKDAGYTCNDGKRKVTLTDIACEYFKCKCCGISKKEIKK